LKRHTKFLIVFISILTLLSGCAYRTAYVMPANIRTANFGGIRYLSLTEYCDRRNLNCSIDKITYVAEIEREGTVVKIMPDSKTLLVDGSIKKISPYPKVKNNEIYISPTFAKYLEENVFITKRLVEAPYKKMDTITRIIIDPGHGGKDPGAIGRHYRLKEKDIALDVSKRLKEELRKLGNFDITLTRTRDNFVSLWKRSQIANDAKADLFISVHANACRYRKVKGFEVFYLSNATDDDARAIAAAENEALSYENNSNHEKPDYLDATVWDIKLSENRTESRELANFICKSASRELGVRNRGTKSARFYVLKGTRMPAVLVEVGFISNKQEEWKLRDPSYRRKVAKSIAKGILAYKDKFDKTQAFTKNSH